MKVLEQRDARRLRAQDGMPIAEIARTLEVAKSSVSGWVKDLRLTADQVATLREANPVLNRQTKGQATRARRARAARRAAQAHGRQKARNGGPLHLMGCMLYWGEGSKARNAVQFVNSDVSMQRLFVRFLWQCYGVKAGRISLSVNCFLDNGLTIDEIHRHWLEALELPKSSLRGPTLNRASRASKRLRRTLPYGTARVVVHSTFVVQSIYGGIQEYAGWDQPVWLDCDRPTPSTAAVSRAMV
jgi:transposase-like protein